MDEIKTASPASALGHTSEDIEAIFSSAHLTSPLWYKDKSQLDTNKPLSTLIARDNQIRELGCLFEPCRSGSSFPPAWTSVIGTPGSGKTALVNHLFQQTIRGSLCTSVSLSGCTSLFGVVNRILECMGLDTLKPRSFNGINLALARIEEEMARRLVDERKKMTLEKHKPFLVLVLDDFDTILPLARIHHTNASEIVGKLLGMMESLRRKGHAAGIIAIMNDSLKDVSMDDRLCSRMETAVVQFPRYTYGEMVNILSDRNSRALAVPVRFEVIQQVAGLCCNENGDARRAIELFKATVDLAFANGIVPAQISRDHVMAANNRCMFSGEKSVYTKAAALPAQHRYILGSIAALTLVTGRNAHTGTEIYDHYKRYVTMTTHGMQSSLRLLGKRRVHDILEIFAADEIVSSVKTSAGRGKGVDKIYTINASINTIGELAFGTFWHQLVSAKENIALLEQLKMVESGLEPYLKQAWVLMIDDRIRERRNRVNLVG